jgi:hypothetical protein
MRLALSDPRRAPVGVSQISVFDLRFLRSDIDQQQECFQNYMILYAMLIQTFHLFHILLQIKN